MERTSARLLPLWTAAIVFASFLHTHSMATRGSVRIKFVKRDRGVQLGGLHSYESQTNQICIYIDAFFKRKVPGMQQNMSHCILRHLRSKQIQLFFYRAGILLDVKATSALH